MGLGVVQPRWWRLFPVRGNSNGLFNQRGLEYVTSHMWSIINRRDTKKTVVNILVNDTNIQLLSHINLQDFPIMLENRVNNDKQIALSLRILSITSRKIRKVIKFDLSNNINKPGDM